MKNALKVIGYLEIGLLLIAVLIWFATRNADDFSGLAVFYPIYAMSALGILALVLLILDLFRHGVMPHTSPRVNAKKYGVLLLCSLPILYMVTEFINSDLYTLIVTSYILTLAVAASLNRPPRIVSALLYVILLGLPILLVRHAQSLNDDNIFFITQKLSILLIAITFVSIISGLRSNSKS